MMLNVRIGLNRTKKKLLPRRRRRRAAHLLPEHLQKSTNLGEDYCLFGPISVQILFNRDNLLWALLVENFIEAHEKVGPLSLFFIPAQLQA